MERKPLHMTSTDLTNGDDSAAGISGQSLQVSYRDGQALSAKNVARCAGHQTEP